MLEAYFAVLWYASRVAPTPSLELLQRADAQVRHVLSNIEPERGGLPTPCSEFNVRALVNHVVYDLQSFTALMSGGQRGSPDTDLIGSNWTSAYAAAADALVSVWRTRGIDGTLTTGLGELPATWALGQHATDLVVHAWDLAQPTGQVAVLDAELAEAALAWGRENLKPQFRGQAFGAEVSVPESAPIYDRLAAFFGRHP